MGSSKINTELRSATRRKLLRGLGALSGTIALPSLVNAQDESATQDAEPMDRYGIRSYYAPEIKLDYWIDGEGKETDFSVKAQEGKWLFMKFWQSWCPGCHKLGFPTLQKFHTAFKDNPNVEMVAIQTVFEGFSVNTKKAVREQQLRYDLPITMGHDAGTKATENHPLTMINYRTGGTPWLVLVAPDGSVVFNDFHVDAESLIGFVGEHAG